MKPVLAVFVFLFVAILIWNTSRRAPLKETPPATTLSTTGLSLKIRIVDRCAFGELDSLQMDTSFKNNAQVLLSIEGPSPTPFFKQLIPLNTLEQSPIDIPIPISLPPGVFQLFLCTDSKGQKGCKHKEALPLGESRARNLVKAKLGQETQDYIFYQKLLLVTNHSNKGQVQAPSNSALAEINKKDSFEFYTKLIAEEKFPLGASQTLVDSMRVSAILPSLDVTIEGKNLVLKWVRFSEKECLIK